VEKQIIRLTGREELKEKDKNEIKTLAFSTDIKYLAAFCKPDKAIVWEWYDKPKIMAESKIGRDIERISINPKEKHLVCTTGANHIGLWTIRDGILKPEELAHIDEKQNFKDHCWLDDDKLVVSSELGFIYIIDKLAKRVM